jgi:hypothetical protein
MFLFCFQNAQSQAKREFTDEEYVLHETELKKKLPSNEFHTTIQKPFVVVGDISPELLKSRWSEKTIKWAVQEFKKLYFTKDPEFILDIWLFKDKNSYLKYTKILWNNEPTTPYGYYSSTDKALVMNISTGGGTLVHEIVHPFMEANFSLCPPWFNEGMGSLYEQSTSKNGSIWGETNWRLAGLKKAINAGNVPTFEKLMAMDTTQFYGGENGNYSSNYAQSRYLLYYLQEKSLLVTYFKEFNKNKKEDPTGFITIKKILNETDMVDFQKRWEAYVLKLVYIE